MTSTKQTVILNDGDYMKKRDERIFSIARLISHTSTYGRIRIGAVLLAGNKIISVGVNSRKSHPIQKRMNEFRIKENHQTPFEWEHCTHSIHAEMEAILHAPYELLNSNKTLSLYIYRESKDGTLRNCRPCPACMAMIKKYNIRNIYYTTNDGYAFEDIS